MLSSKSWRIVQVKNQSHLGGYRPAHSRPFKDKALAWALLSAGAPLLGRRNGLAPSHQQHDFCRVFLTVKRVSDRSKPPLVVQHYFYKIASLRRATMVEHNARNADSRCLLAQTKRMLAIPKTRAESSIFYKAAMISTAIDDLMASNVVHPRKMLFGITALAAEVAVDNKKTAVLGDA